MASLPVPRLDFGQRSLPITLHIVFWQVPDGLHDLCYPPPLRVLGGGGAGEGEEEAVGEDEADAVDCFRGFGGGELEAVEVSEA